MKIIKIIFSQSILNILKYYLTKILNKIEKLGKNFVLVKNKNKKPDNFDPFKLFILFSVNLK